MLLVRGVKDIGDIQAKDALEQAYRLGQSCIPRIGNEAKDDGDGAYFAE